MKSSTLTRCLVAALAIAGSFAATAQTVSAQADAQADANAQIAAQPDANATLAQQDQNPSKPLNEERCLRETGTLIKQRDKNGKPACIQQAPGRSYSNEDISRTGQTDLADALRQLDTSIH